MTYKRLAILCLMALTLSACGGGGGSNGSSADTTKPAITLKGESTVILEVGDTFFDAGVIAVDKVDGDLSKQVTISGSVGDGAGSYTITYSVQDSAGNTNTVTRTVIRTESTGGNGSTDGGNGSTDGGNGSTDGGSGTTDGSAGSTDSTTNSIDMIEGFGGALYDSGTSTYTFPTGSETWAGFANMNSDVYPMSFAEEGTITFTAAIPAGASDTSIYFRFERLPYPDVEPAFNLDPVLITGEAELEYTVTVPAQPSGDTFSSFLMYVVDRDSPVIVKNIVVTDDANSGNTPSSGGDSTTGGGSAIAKAINTDKWFHQTRLPNGFSWWNGEIQHYTNRMQNSYVSNGSLKIVAKKETFTDQGHTKQYTSARLNSKYAFQYGRVVVRAKLPTGAGTWPAIWTLGKNISENGAYWQTQGYGTTSWPYCGEIDIMEHWGRNQNYVQSAMHTPSSYGGTVNHGGRYISTATSKFHVYEMDWNSERIIFSVDGVEHYRYDPVVKDSSTWPYDAEQYLVLNIAIEPIIASSFSQSEMEIDYVRVYADGAGPSDDPIWADEFD